MYSFRKQSGRPKYTQLKFVMHALLGFALALVGSRGIIWNEISFKFWEIKWFMGLEVHQYAVKHANPLL